MAPSPDNQHNQIYNIYRYILVDLYLLSSTFLDLINTERSDQRRSRSRRSSGRNNLVSLRTEINRIIELNHTHRMTPRRAIMSHTNPSRLYRRRSAPHIMLHISCTKWKGPGGACASEGKEISKCWACYNEWLVRL